MRILIALLVGFIFGIFATIIAMILIADHDKRE